VTEGKLPDSWASLVAWISSSISLRLTVITPSFK
jgi:hypothetical protein